MSQQIIAIPPTQPTSAPGWKRWLSLDNRFVPPIFITLILLGGQIGFGILESYEKTLVAIGTAIVLEMALGRYFTGKFPHAASAYITGISVGILLRSPAYWPYALCAAIAITSKYVLRYKGHHLWNPSNFGICVVLFLLPASSTMLSIQWGNNIWSLAVIWLLGSIIIWRLHRFHISATYAVAFILLAVVRAYILHQPVLSEISPITSPEYQLFIFFMITDPKTTVRSKLGQSLVVVAVAILEMLFRLDQSVYAELYALFWIGPIAMLIEMWLNSRRMKSAPASPVLATQSQVAPT